MEVITIESDAFAEIVKMLKGLNDKFIKLEFDAKYPLSEKWLDNQEVTQLLNVSKRTLQMYRDESMIAFSQVGNKMYYKTIDVEQFLKDNYNEAKKAN